MIDLKTDKTLDVYSDTPLLHTDSVRLLTLRPAPSKDNVIEISLAEARLGAQPYYSALSYTWATEDGDATSCCMIVCNGQRLMVTKSCNAALRRLREQAEPVTLWIDSICINQSDNNERSSQVALMRDVYKNAARVPIWLGDASALTDNTTRKPVSTIFLEYFLSMADEMRSYKKAGKDIATSPLYCKLRSEVSNAMMTDDKTPLAIGLSDIEQRRWWKRV